MTVLVVTGTSTGVGKTVVTAAVAALGVAAGRAVAVVKAAQTGTEPGSGAADTDVVRRLVGHPEPTLCTLATYPEPLAPATAARRSGRPPLRLDEAVLAVRERVADHDLVLVEGAGGLLVRFADDPPWTVLDLAAALTAPVLVVAHAGLGTLNHTALTAEVLRARGVEPHGVVVGAWPDKPGLAERCNLEDLAAAGAGPLVGALPDRLGSTEQPGAFLASARAGLAPLLGGTFDAADFIRTHAPEPKATE